MRKGLLAIVVALALPATAAAQGTVQEVVVGESDFTPETVAFESGSTSVHWGWTTELPHNVVQDDGIFDSGPASETGELTVTPSAGTFGYFCEVHGFRGGIGMAGTIKAKPTATVRGNRAELVWANPGTDTGTRFDVRQRVGKKKPKVVEEKTRKFSGTFKLKSGKNQFQVRSRQSKAVSHWSPKLNLKG